MKRLRRSMLFIPGNHPGMLQNADVFGSDSVIFDLEDAVSLREKDSARNLVKNALMSVDFGQAERVVRINPLDTFHGPEDVKAMVSVFPDALMIPKATAARLREVDELITELEASEKKDDFQISLIPIIESAEAVEDINHLLKASPRIIAALLGAEDLTAEMGIQRTKKGEELSYVRSRLATACCAAKIDAIDTPFADTFDEEGLKADTLKGKSLGFTGKAAIHPAQIEGIHQVFAPTEEEILEAERIVEAMQQAEKEGKGAVALDGQMVDMPIILRAEKLLRQAKAMGLTVEIEISEGGIRDAK